MEISERSDAFRKSIPYVTNPRNKLLLTRGIYAEFNDKQIADIFLKVRDFSDFNENNDPWEEHDFGVIILDGKKIFWKIDNYNGQDDMDLVLTIMLAEEY